MDKRKEGKMDRAPAVSETVLSERKLSETGRSEPRRRSADLERKDAKRKNALRATLAKKSRKAGHAQTILGVQ